MAYTVFAEQSPEFRKTEALIAARHPAMIKAKREAEARWKEIFGGIDDVARREATGG